MLPAIRSSRFDLPLTYTTEENLQIGDVVHVPLGRRAILGYIVSEPRRVQPHPKLRAISGRAEAPRAFTAVGLALARWVAEYYVCTLGEALAPLVLGSATPRLVDFFRATCAEPPFGRHPSLPRRLLELMWAELTGEFRLEQLLRHPAARRIADRGGLLHALGALTRSGDLVRERSLSAPRLQPYRVRRLRSAQRPSAGKRMQALYEFVAAQPGVPRADAVLAGFSTALLARAVKTGVLIEESVAAAGAQKTPLPPQPEFPPTADQQRAIAAIGEAFARDAFAEFLLQGITGSGKTLVYVEAIKDVVRAGRTAIVLVPEISLTPQTARRFESVFGERVAVFHSALAERERYDAWQACFSSSVDVVVGPRSAVFAPLPQVGLIVVDEAHEPSYKQDATPRYHALAVARERMRIEQGTLVIGSATPPLESYYAVQSGTIVPLALPERVRGMSLPQTSIVDMAAEFQAGNRRIFSSALVSELETVMERGEKAVLFINRRGSAGFVLCRNCGYVPRCRRCSVSLAVHRTEALLRCHYCDAQTPIPQRCPSCKAEAIKEFGVGTERVVQEVARLFPQARTIRMDSDSTAHIGDHARLLERFEHDGDVLVGTQMVAKGLDFATVTLAAAIAADLGLHAADFRAAERTFDLLAQVAGRSGRASPGKAIVQTYSPQHPAIRFAANHDYSRFAEGELVERKALNYPPFSSLVYLGIIGRERRLAAARAAEYAELLRERLDAEVLGPAPYPIARLNNEWRFRIAVKSGDLSAVRAVLRGAIRPLANNDHRTRLAINVDP